MKKIISLLIPFIFILSSIQILSGFSYKAAGVLSITSVTPFTVAGDQAVLELTFNNPANTGGNLINMQDTDTYVQNDILIDGESVKDICSSGAMDKQVWINYVSGKMDIWILNTCTEKLKLDGTDTIVFKSGFTTPAGDTFASDCTLTYNGTTWFINKIISDLSISTVTPFVMDGNQAVLELTFNNPANIGDNLINTQDTDVFVQNDILINGKSVKDICNSGATDTQVWINYVSGKMDIFIRNTCNEKLNFDGTDTIVLKSGFTTPTGHAVGSNISYTYITYSSIWVPSNFVTFGNYKVSAENVISNIRPGTTLTAFKNSLSPANGVDVEFTNVHTSGGTVGTGTNVDITVNGAVIQYTIEINGDVNGDGKISLSDLTSIRDYLLDKQQIQGIFQTAGNLYGESDISLNDLVGVMSYITGVGDISQLPFIAAKLPAGATSYLGVTLTRPTYDYAPSVMYGDGSQIKMWWLGFAGTSDGIYYSTLSTSGWSTPQLVLQHSASGWDSCHVGDPSVIKGTFSYHSTNYSYAMYFTGTYSAPGYDGHIGVAFSNDGINWVKDSANPIISPLSSATTQYGAGMPTVYEASNGTITMCYFDSTGESQNFMVTSTDGINFSNKTQLPYVNNENIGDIAYSPSEGKWYISTKYEDSYINIYETSTSSILSGWNYTGCISQTSTGNTSNHNPGWLRWPNGDIYIEPNTNYKYIYYGTGNNNDISYGSSWDIGYSTYTNSWEFNVNGNREGWTAYNMSNDSGPSNGLWNVTANQVEPQWVSPNIEFPAVSCHNIEIRTANQNADTSGKIYFKTDAENFFSEDKTVTFTNTNGGGWFVHSVDMTANAKWTGKITGIRIDPIVTGSGKPMGIDYVRLCN